MNSTIDFVILWVDGNDPAWQAERTLHDPSAGAADARLIRYRDWENLHFWFRGIDAYTPWVNRIHFVTWGHLPPWLNTENPKLNIVRHSDFISQKYLPTFSSHPIEMNLHRIPGIAEQFVYFNDDMFILRPMEAEEFFKNGLPRDCGVLAPYPADVKNSIASIVANDMEIINTTFDRRKTIRSAPLKWFNPRYRWLNRYTLCSLVFPRYTGFWGSHFPNNYLKRTYEQVWDKEFDTLDATSSHRFRDRRDVNQWLIRYWQLANNQFLPRSVYGRRYFPLKDDMTAVVRAITTQSELMVCLNDREDISDFEGAKRQIQQAFEQILPNKSSFER